MSILTLIKSGGWIMFPLIILSIVAWAVCVERYWALRNWKEKNREFLLSFQNLWLRGDKDTAVKLCDKSTLEIADLAKEAVNAIDHGFKSTRLADKIERRRLEHSAEIKKNLWLLGTIGSATPFVGLFGTVVGIMKAFQSMAESGSGGFAVVAAGISEALIATAAGIIVAVIAVFFYNYFQVKSGQIQFQLKLFTEELLDIFETDKKGAA